MTQKAVTEGQLLEAVLATDRNEWTARGINATLQRLYGITCHRETLGKHLKNWDIIARCEERLRQETKKAVAGAVLSAGVETLNDIVQQLNTIDVANDATLGAVKSLVEKVRAVTWEKVVTVRTEFGPGEDGKVAETMRETTTVMRPVAIEIVPLENTGNLATLTRAVGELLVASSEAKKNLAEAAAMAGPPAAEGDAGGPVEAVQDGIISLRERRAEREKRAEKQ